MKKDIFDKRVLGVQKVLYETVKLRPWRNYFLFWPPRQKVGKIYGKIEK